MKSLLLELLDEIKALFKYFNNGYYFFFIMFLVSIIFIFFKEKDKKKKYFFVGYSIIILLVIWNPVCIWVLNKFINLGSMYRIYYMLPTLITISYAITKFVEEFNSVQKIFLVIIFGAGIVSFGTSIFNEYSMIKVDNLYKLPDETVEIAYAISDDEETEYKKAIVPYGMSSRIRQVRADIDLVYTRVVTPLYDENGKQLPSDSDDASNYEPVQKLNAGDVKYIVGLCKRTNTNYVVFQKATKLTEKMEDYGFKLFYETQNYNVYRLVEKNND